MAMCALKQIYVRGIVKIDLTTIHRPVRHLSAIRGNIRLRRTRLLPFQKHIYTQHVCICMCVSAFIYAREITKNEGKYCIHF